MTPQYELTNRYRAGFYGSKSGFTFESPSPQEAWAKARSFFMGEHSSRTTAVMERLVLIQNPPVEFIGGQEPGILDKLRTEYWFRVVVGCPDFGWPGEPAGGGCSLCAAKQHRPEF